MRSNKLSLFVHFVWATWDRLPLIDSAIEEGLHHCLHGLAVRAGCKVLAIGGIEDHVHLLLEVPPTLSVSTLMRDLKGASSHWVNEELQPQQLFKWQSNYAAFTVSSWDVPKVANYIQRQKQHHTDNTVRLQLEMQTA